MPTSHHMQNNNSKWITDRRVRPKTINLLDENPGENTCSFVAGKDLFIYIANKRHWSFKKKKDNLGCITIKHLQPLKNTIKEIKREYID